MTKTGRLSTNKASEINRVIPVEVKACCNESGQWDACHKRKKSSLGLLVESGGTGSDDGRDDGATTPSPVAASTSALTSDDDNDDNANDDDNR